MLPRRDQLLHRVSGENAASNCFAVNSCQSAAEGALFSRSVPPVPRAAAVVFPLGDMRQHAPEFCDV